MGSYTSKLACRLGPCGKLEQLQDLLAHKVTRRDLGMILDRAPDALLAEVHNKKKTALVADSIPPTQFHEAPFSLPHAATFDHARPRLTRSPTGPLPSAMAQ